MFTISMIDFFISKMKNGILENKVICIFLCVLAIIVPLIVVYQEKEPAHNLFGLWLGYFLLFLGVAYHFFSVYNRVNKGLIIWIKIDGSQIYFVTVNNSRIECLLSEIIIKKKQDFEINTFDHRTWVIAGTINNEDNETFIIFLKKRKFYLKAGLFENRELLYDFINEKVQE